MENNFNVHLGKKLRMRRLSLGLTQTKVAEAINVTFQQIQKYEKGTNAVSSARLMQISQFLKVSIPYFYQDYKDYRDLESADNGLDKPNGSEDLNFTFLIKTFSSLSRTDKEKILQVLRNTENLNQTG
jgi:transcriptional regulator with XRE-family HTH domain